MAFQRHCQFFLPLARLLTVFLTTQKLKWEDTKLGNTQQWPLPKACIRCLWGIQVGQNGVCVVRVGRTPTNLATCKSSNNTHQWHRKSHNLSSCGVLFSKKSFKMCWSLHKIFRQKKVEKLTGEKSHEIQQTVPPNFWYQRNVRRWFRPWTGAQWSHTSPSSGGVFHKQYTNTNHDRILVLVKILITCIPKQPTPPCETRLDTTDALRFRSARIIRQTKQEINRQLRCLLLTTDHFVLRGACS